MKKLVFGLFACLFVVGASIGALQNKVVTIDAGDTFATLQNSQGSGWVIEDVFILSSTNASDSDTIGVYKVITEGDVFIDSGIIASNATSAVIDLATETLVVPSGTSIKIKRTATTTNTTMYAVVVIDTQE